MPYKTHNKYLSEKLKHVKYGFFTNEYGISDGGYVVVRNQARNVHLYSPNQPDQPGVGYDSARNVISNLMACFNELTAHEPDSLKVHKFVMTSVGDASVLSCSSIEELAELKLLSQSKIESLGLNRSLLSELEQARTHVLRADSIVFKGIPGHTMMGGGASADAHPIIMIDDEHKVCSYIAGTHTALKAGIIEKTLNKMIELGAFHENIRILIGPGLGPNSYEFDAHAAEYLNLPKDKVTAVEDPEKRLLDIEKIVRFKAMGFVNPDNIHNLDIDTMGFDLYSAGKQDVNASKLRSNQWLPFFSARRELMMDPEDTKSHSKVWRHFAGFTLGG